MQTVIKNRWTTRWTNRSFTFSNYFRQTCIYCFGAPKIHKLNTITALLGQFIWNWTEQNCWSRIITYQISISVLSIRHFEWMENIAKKNENESTEESTKFGRDGLFYHQNSNWWTANSKFDCFWPFSKSTRKICKWTSVQSPFGLLKLLSEILDAVWCNDSSDRIGDIMLWLGMLLHTSFELPQNAIHFNFDFEVCYIRSNWEKKWKLNLELQKCRKTWKKVFGRDFKAVPWMANILIWKTFEPNNLLVLVLFHDRYKFKDELGLNPIICAIAFEPNTEGHTDESACIITDMIRSSATDQHLLLHR